MRKVSRSGCGSLHQHLARQHLRIGEDLGEPEHGAGRHARGVEHLDPVRDVGRREHGLERGEQRLAMAHARGQFTKRGSSGPLGVPQREREAIEDRVVRGGDDHDAVARAEATRRRRERMLVARGPGAPAALEVHARAPRQHADRGLEQRGVDELAAPGPLAREQRELDAVRREDPREQIRDRDPDARRAALVGAGEAHQAAHGLRDRVEAGAARVRAVGAEARDAAHHEARMAAQQLGRIEAERREHAGPVVLDQHVGASRAGAPAPPGPRHP